MDKRMNRVVLFTGKPQAGKTVIIKKIIHTIGENQCGGFYTEEIRSDGKRIGFRIVTIDGQSRLLAKRDSESRTKIGNYGVDIRIIDSFGIQAINEATSHKNYIVVDEIGPMQLASEKFQRVIFELLSGAYNLIGTIVLRSHPIADIIKNHPKAEVVYLNSENRNKIFDNIITQIRHG